MRLNLDSPRVFYGWWIVGAAFLLALYTGGVVAYGITALFEPLASEFGWSYAQISFAASLRGLETGLLAPVGGLLVDRWGPRKLIFSGVTITALGLIFLSRTTSLGIFYGAFALVSLGISTCSTTVLITAVANWFRGKVGIATGIASCGYGFGGLMVPLIVGLIQIYEWRMTMVILGIGMLTMGLPLSLLMRHKPEQYGYLPDGEISGRVTPDKGSAPPQIVEVNIGAKQALKSSTFWHIALAQMCRLLMIGALIAHIMPYLSSIGIARAASGFIASTVPLMSIVGRLSFGWLGDRLDKRRVAAGGFTMMSVGMLFFGAAAGNMWLLVPFIILVGISYGGVNIVCTALVRERFGRSRFGAIFGSIIGIMMLGNISGAPLAGWVFDTWGSYQGLWFVFAGLAAAAIIIVVTIPPARATIQLTAEPRGGEDTL